MLPMLNYLSFKEMVNMGFKNVGKNVKISKKASIYSPKTTKYGNNIRIDDFCLISGNIQFKNNIHIASGAKLFGDIVMHGYNGISPNSIVLQKSDVLTGEFMLGPTNPDKYRKVVGVDTINIGKHAMIATNTVIVNV